MEALGIAVLSLCLRLLCEDLAMPCLRSGLGIASRGEGEAGVRKGVVFEFVLGSFRSPEDLAVLAATNSQSSVIGSHELMSGIHTRVGGTFETVCLSMYRRRAATLSPAPAKSLLAASPRLNPVVILS